MSRITMYAPGMRTTLNLDDDVAAAVERMRREDGMGLSEAVNALARRGLVRSGVDKGYRHRSVSLGLRIDVDDVAGVLDLLDANDEGE